MLCFSLIVVETGIFIHFVALKFKYKKPIFESWVSFTSYFLINFIVFLLCLIGLSMQEWHTPEYNRVHNITFQNKTVSDWLSWLVISMIALSIILEVVKAIISVIESFKTRKLSSVPKCGPLPMALEYLKIQEDASDSKTQGSPGSEGKLLMKRANLKKSNPSSNKIKISILRNKLNKFRSSRKIRRGKNKSLRNFSKKNASKPNGSKFNRIKKSKFQSEKLVLRSKKNNARNIANESKTK